MSDTADPSDPVEQFHEHATPDAVSFITQRQLGRFLELKRLAADFETLQRQLREALDQGASVEPGPLTACLDVREGHRLTLAYVFAALGLTRQDVVGLRADCPPSRCRHVRAEQAYPRRCGYALGS